MRRSIVSALACLALLPLATSGGAEEVRSIEPKELHERVEAGEPPVILDVRTPEEFSAGHIPGAINIPHTELASRMSELDPDSDVALYCMVGPRARLGEQTLTQAGRGGVLHIEGGLAAWESAGFPIQKSSGPE